MQQVKHPYRIVILGGGFGGSYALKKIHQRLHGDSSVSLTLISNTNYFLFTPLLHEVATGGVAPPLVIEPLRKVLGCCLQDFYLADVKGLNLDDKKIETSLGSLSYDALIVALGSTTNFYGVTGAVQHAFTLKTLDDAVRLKNHIIAQFEQASHELQREKRRRLLRFVIIGGGPTGVELAAELSDFCYSTFRKMYRQSQLIHDINIVLLETAGKLLSNLAPKMSAASLRVLQSKQVMVRLESPVVRVAEQFVELQSGEQLDTTTSVWVAGVQPQPINIVGEVSRDAQGRLEVKPTMQLPHYPTVFAIGDLAHTVDSRGHTLPALAQVASKQGSAAAANLIRVMHHQTPQPFMYRHAGDLVSLGHWTAVAHIHNLFFMGRFAWWLWRTVYLFKLLSVRKKLKVLIDWTFDLFEPRDISQTYADRFGKDSGWVDE